MEFVCIIDYFPEKVLEKCNALTILFFFIAEKWEIYVTVIY